MEVFDDADYESSIILTVLYIDEIDGCACMGACVGGCVRGWAGGGGGV